MALAPRRYSLAPPRFLVVRLTEENREEVAAWCRLPTVPNRSLAFIEEAEPGDYVVRPAEWDGERPGGFTYTPEELAGQFDERGS